LVFVSYFLHIQKIYSLKRFTFKNVMALIQKLIIFVTWLKAYVTSEQEKKEFVKKN